MPGRQFTSSTGYRYGFNGHEKDDEVSGGGNAYDFEGYGYDPRTGRRKGTDPAASKFPDISPYAAFGNNPILFIDKNGEEIYIYPTNGNKPVLYKPNHRHIFASRFVRQTEKALNYVYKHDSKGTIGKLARDTDSKNRVNISFEEGKGAFGSSQTSGEITYNPNEGLSISNDVNVGTQSPALRLFHEIAHQYGRIYHKKEYAERKKNGTEEPYVIGNFETPVAEALGEPVRKNEDHSQGVESTVSDVTSHSFKTAKAAAKDEKAFQEQIDKDIESGMFDGKGNKEEKK